jgi:hypothetical protein
MTDVELTSVNVKKVESPLIENSPKLPETVSKNSFIEYLLEYYE